MGNCIVAQSGGPTSVINATLAGVVKANQLNPIYTKVYGGLHGIEGILQEKLVDLTAMSEDEAASWQMDIEQGYRRFIDIVAKGRNKKVEEVEKIAEGRVWDGETALKLGLVDKLGNLQEAIAEALPGRLPEAIGPDGLEDMRRRLVALTEIPDRARIHKDDYAGAFGVFLLVVLSTFPVVLPFVLFDDVGTAKAASRAVALVLLFFGGLALGRYAGYGSWKAGLLMAGVGAALVAAIMALGG